MENRQPDVNSIDPNTNGTDDGFHYLPGVIKTHQSIKRKHIQSSSKSSNARIQLRQFCCDGRIPKRVGNAAIKQWLLSEYTLKITVDIMLDLRFLMVSITVK